MNLEDRLDILMFEIDELEIELKKAEIYEARLLSFKNDELIRKDCLEENIAFLKKRGVIASIDEFRIIQRNLNKTIDAIKGYDRDIERLRSSVQLQKNKLAIAKEQEQKLICEIEKSKKGNILQFKRK